MLMLATFSLSWEVWLHKLFLTSSLVFFAIAAVLGIVEKSEDIAKWWKKKKEKKRAVKYIKLCIHGYSKIFIQNFGIEIYNEFIEKKYIHEYDFGGQACWEVTAKGFSL